MNKKVVFVMFLIVLAVVWGAYFLFISPLKKTATKNPAATEIEKTVAEFKRAERGDLIISKEGILYIITKKDDTGLFCRPSMSTSMFVNYKSLRDNLRGSYVITKYEHNEHHKFLLKFALGENADEKGD